MSKVSGSSKVSNSSVSGGIVESTKGNVLASFRSSLQHLKGLSQQSFLDRQLEKYSNNEMFT